MLWCFPEAYRRACMTLFPRCWRTWAWSGYFTRWTSNPESHSGLVVIPTDRKHTLVFGLPGNPVSSLVGCELFVRPALLKMSGWREPGPRYGIAKMADEYRVCRDRITFLPARGWEHEGELFVTAIAWKGSGDLCGMASANYLIRLPKGDFPVPRGQPIAVLKL